VAQVVLLLSFTAFASSSVGADAITGTSSGVPSSGGAVTASGGGVEGDSPMATSFTVAGTTIFDPGGTALLVVSPSQSIDLFEPREKLRGGSLLSSGVLASLGSGVSSSSLNNASLGPSRDYLSGTTSSGGSGTGPASVAPEPSVLLLLAFGLALAARRITRSDRQTPPR
jgi:hypothetical protein